MKAYIYHTCDVCPWFVIHEVNETKKRFILCQGMGWDKGRDCPVKKISKKKFDMLKAEGLRIENEYRETRERLHREAQNLLK